MRNDQKNAPSMRADCRLSRMLHVLLHMARHDEPFTSDEIAKMLRTNPVVVRRTMAGLRDAGYVRSRKGTGGGWTLDCDFEKVTLLDIHRAVGEAQLFAISQGERSPDCAVEKVVNKALADAMKDAEQLLLDRLGTIALADLLEDFDRLCTEGGWGKTGPAMDLHGT